MPSIRTTTPIELQQPTTMMPVASLLPADSPRRRGENTEHTRLLAESADPLPPILIDRRTLRVVDGMHRLNAAVLRGETEVEVKFFDGTEMEAFVAAVEVNVRHGLPLSLGDRKAAASRIMRSAPAWSDRAVAKVTALSPKTVASVRRNSPPDSTPPTMRIGRDGKARPISSAEGRAIARDAMAGRPDASIRDIARAAGISTGTVRAVRREMDRSAVSRTAASRSVEHSAKDPALILRTLQGDPSVKLTTTGRHLLRLLSTQMLGPADWNRLASTVPSHCAPLVLELVKSLVTQWESFGIELERQVCN